MPAPAPVRGSDAFARRRRDEMKTLKPTRKNKSLARDEKGGTDFVELLIMVALIAFVVIAGEQSGMHGFGMAGFSLRIVSPEAVVYR